MSPFKLEEVLPELSKELRSLLKAQGEIVLAEQIPSLRIFERCRCEEDSCETIYTVPGPTKNWGPKHRNIDLDASEGLLILDVVDQEITCIEILYRDDVRTTSEGKS